MIKRGIMDVNGLNRCFVFWTQAASSTSQLVDLLTFFLEFFCFLKKYVYLWKN